MCTFFAVSRAAYYAWLKRSQQPDKDSARLQAVQQAWEKSHRTYGYRRVALWLRQHKGLVINHKAVLRLMNKLNIRSIARQRHPYKQRARLDFHQRYANLSKCSAHTDPVSRPSFTTQFIRDWAFGTGLHCVARDFAANQPNQKWVTDTLAPYAVQVSPTSLPNKAGRIWPPSRTCSTVSSLHIVWEDTPSSTDTDAVCTALCGTGQFCALSHRYPQAGQT